MLVSARLGIVRIEDGGLLLGVLLLDVLVLGALILGVLVLGASLSLGGHTHKSAVSY
jgi:hypothetical protein